MPRNGNGKAGAATKEAPEATKNPKDIYDELSQNEQDIHDRIAAAGWKPVQAGRGWKAEKDTGLFKEGGALAESVGPFPELADLEAAITEAGAKSGKTLDDFKLEGGATPENGNGGGAKGKKVKASKQSLLPGTENAVLEDLRTAVLAYRATTMEILGLQEQQKDEKKRVMGLMHKFEDELTVDKETGFKFFQAGSIIAELEVVTKEELKTRTAALAS